MNSTDTIISRAQALNLKARKLAQKRGGFRKHSSAGSTHSPLRAVEIEGVSYSHARARQVLDGLEAGRIDRNWCFEHEGWR